MQTLTLIKLVQFSIEPWRQHLTTEQGGKKVTYAIFQTHSTPTALRMAVGKY